MIEKNNEDYSIITFKHLDFIPQNQYFEIQDEYGFVDYSLIPIDSNSGLFAKYKNKNLQIIKQDIVEYHNLRSNFILFENKMIFL